MKNCTNRHKFKNGLNHLQLKLSFIVCWILFFSDYNEKTYYLNNVKTDPKITLYTCITRQKAFRWNLVGITECEAKKRKNINIGYYSTSVYVNETKRTFLKQRECNARKYYNFVLNRTLIGLGYSLA